ncbi:hypothetical protein ACWCYY_31745 [Kitasatospora sp. NPDC001664]
MFRPVDDVASDRYRAEALEPTTLNYVMAAAASQLRAETTGPGIAGISVDSNADQNGNVPIQTGGPGRNDHRYDIGIYPSPAFPLLGDGPVATFTGSLAVVGLGTGFVLWRRSKESTAWLPARQAA